MHNSSFIIKIFLCLTTFHVVGSIGGSIGVTGRGGKGGKDIKSNWTSCAVLINQLNSVTVLLE